ncbi:FAD-dependent oxidoreductase [Shewanella woodyi]|uniref:FAD-dependent pyridine nucleotide-disulphide oxidoreductase n=1 Tax=Shewanella woodyi (strain ATCC 51908 / MS32) TaxID=392500 RepID=B1KH21_SHEWM|nr:FAD-dependent oxidoreductase [Shewanella woodyi]ACA88333.1 FAD-dependent pyridine nucleotide-disulphide oxidoreductase [Shewanella woodyi ATCC 51908]
MKKLLIIGGVAGGASAAARARRLNEEAEIIMFERGEFVSFANCGLPYHISGEIPERSALILQTPASFKSRFNVDVRVQQEVIAIDKVAKTLLVKNLITGEQYSESYDALLLSPGAAPITPPIPGLNTPLTFSLRNIPDMDRILASVKQSRPRHVTVVGGGFIGLEMMESFHALNIEVTLLELSNQVMAPVDIEMANMLHSEILAKGIDLRLNTGLASVEQTSSGLSLFLSNGESLDTELLICAIGVKPETRLAVDAGLVIGELGGIIVDEMMRTSDADIYAVGDAVEEFDLLTGEKCLVPLAGPANRQGRIAANNIFGGSASYKKTQGTAICRVFDLAIASTGLSEKRLAKTEIPFDKVYLHGASHASYFPGAHPISLKLLFNTDNGKILGAQALGRDGVDKRIDVLAVAIRAGLTVYDLQEMELTYAPPYGSAKDLLNQAGFVATNSLKGETCLCHSADIDARDDSQVLLDVRNPGELLKAGSIAGAINIPLDQLRERLNELPRDREVLVFCQVGLRGHVAYRMLVNHGFKVRNLSGGFKTYQAVTA